MKRENHLYRQSSSFFIAFFIFAVSTAAQTTAFNYQGKLTSGGNPANGSFQMEFKLFDALSNGTQIGATVVNSSVSVAQGVFAVSLDFGANAFTGADRFLEIAVKRNAGDPLTILAPRQKLSSVPFAIRSLDAAKLGGFDSNTYLQNNGDGSALSNLNAANIVSGTLNDDRLSLNVAKLDADNIFTGNNTVSNLTLAGDGQITALRLENAAKDPVPAAAENAGRIYFNTTDNTVKVSNGTSWVSLSPSTPSKTVIQTFSGNTSGSVSCANGVIQSVTFTKQFDSSRLRITYHDHAFSFGGTIAYRKEIRLFIDNANIAPLALFKEFGATYYQAPNNAFLYQVNAPITIIGYAENVSAGEHTLASKYLAATNAACRKGENGSAFLIEIEEIP
jgi:hypothetical protein